MQFLLSQWFYRTQSTWQGNWEMQSAHNNTHLSVNISKFQEGMIHISNGMLLSHKKEPNWVICRDVDGPWGCQIEWISQKEKNKYHILMHICGIWKKIGIDDFTCKTKTDEENRCMDIKGEGGVRWTERLELTQIHYWYMCKIDN